MVKKLEEFKGINLERMLEGLELLRELRTRAGSHDDPSVRSSLVCECVEVPPCHTPCDTTPMQGRTQYEPKTEIQYQ